MKVFDLRWYSYLKRFSTNIPMIDWEWKLYPFLSVCLMKRLKVQGSLARMDKPLMDNIVYLRYCPSAHFRSSDCHYSFEKDSSLIRWIGFRTHRGDNASTCCWNQYKIIAPKVTVLKGVHRFALRSFVRIACITFTNVTVIPNGEFFVISIRKNRCQYFRTHFIICTYAWGSAV